MLQRLLKMHSQSFTGYPSFEQMTKSVPLSRARVTYSRCFLRPAKFCIIWLRPSSAQRSILSVPPTFSLLCPCSFHSSPLSALTPMSPPLSLYFFPLLISRVILLARAKKRRGEERRMLRRWGQNRRRRRRRPCLVWPAAPDSIRSPLPLFPSLSLSLTHSPTLN